MGLDRGAVSARQLFFERFANLENHCREIHRSTRKPCADNDLAQLLPEVRHTPLKPSGFGSSVGNILICRQVRVG
jgi:hypothetical protein